MNQIAVLDTVFRNDRTLFRSLVRHPENVLRRHIILREPPTHFLGHIWRLHAANPKRSGLRVHITDFELPAILIVVDAVRLFLEVHETAVLKSGQVFAIYFRATSDVFDFLHAVPDEITSNIIQFVFNQLVIAAQVVIQIHLKAPGHVDELQIVLSARNEEGVLFQTLLAGAPIFLQAHLAAVSRKTKKPRDTIQLLCTKIHELVIKPKYIVSNHNVGVFTLYQVSPRKHDLPLCGIRLNDRILDLRKFSTRVPSNAVVHIRFLVPVTQEGRSNKCHLVTFQSGKYIIQ